MRLENYNLFSLSERHLLVLLLSKKLLMLKLRKLRCLDTDISIQSMTHFLLKVLRKSVFKMYPLTGFPYPREP